MFEAGSQRVIAFNVMRTDAPVSPSPSKQTSARFFPHREYTCYVGGDQLKPSYKIIQSRESL